MRTTIIILFIALIFCAANVGAQTWVCGNINDDPIGNVDISDMTYLFYYLMGDGPAPNNLPLADIDDHTGVAPPDATYFVRYIFGGLWGTTLNCVPTQSYTYTVSTDDTIFIPRMTDIPEGVSQITLPVDVSVAANTIGFYVPILLNGSGSSDNFSLTSSNDLSNGNLISFGTYSNADTAILSVNDRDDYMPTERTTYFHLIMTRDQAGIGSVMSEGVDRSPQWPLCVIKEDFDMYIPVIQYVDVKGYSVELSFAQLNFTNVLGFPPPDVVYTVEISSPADPINWLATYSASWLNVDLLSGTTPSSMNVSIDPTGLDAGMYVDTIRFVDDDNPLGDPVELPVYLMVRSPFPSMDANCDGKFNISDLAYIVSYLFGNPTGPAPCDPCTGTFPNGE
jgi:hypothetical protein